MDHSLRATTDHFCCLDPPPYTCRSCNFQTDLTVTLINHVRVSHDQKYTNYPELTVPSNYDCKNCDFATFSLLVLTKHSSNCNKVFVSSERPYRCEKCQSCFIEKHHLSVHVIRKHTDVKDIKWFQCDQCPYKAKIENDFKQHVKRKHSADNEWLECDQCPYRAKLKDVLRKHVGAKHSISRKTESKTYKCDKCSRCYTQVRHLNLHILMKHPAVTKGNLFQCDQCPYSANGKYNLKEHVKEVHKEKVYECQKCSVRFSRRYNLKIHMIRKHTSAS